MCLMKSASQKKYIEIDMINLEIIDVRHLFKEITGELIPLLRNLDDGEWLLPTCYPDWKVKDIVSHLLQTAIGRLSKQRDRFPTSEKPRSLQFPELVRLVSKANDGWTATYEEDFESVYPQLLCPKCSSRNPVFAGFEWADYSQTRFGRLVVVLKEGNIVCD
jgi:hypothetical protein